MVEREKLLEIAGRKHGREIYKHLKGSKEFTYYNELCRKLELPSGTINRYLRMMEESKIIKLEWQEKTIPRYDKKVLKSKISRQRKVWVRAISILQTDEARTLDSIIYGT